jgi:protein ImuA
MRIAPASIRYNAIPAAVSRWTFGTSSLDVALGGGLARGRIHEIYAAEGEDSAAAAGFAIAVATGMADPDGTVLWLRSRQAVRPGGVIQAAGWAEMGGVPGQGLVGVMPDAMSLLRAAVDALRTPALSAVVVEGWGAMRELDLTASRRLALAAEKSGVPLLLLRMDAAPVPSPAQTRWQVAAASSRALAGNAPGRPCFAVTLLRQRSGPRGLAWRLEWDRDQRQFNEAPLSGAVVPVPADRPVADRGGGASRQTA